MRAIACQAALILKSMVSSLFNVSEGRAICYACRVIPKNYFIHKSPFPAFRLIFLILANLVAEKLNYSAGSLLNAVMTFFAISDKD